MINAISQATAGMLAQERRLAGAAQNVANDTTPGYKPAGGASQQGPLMAAQSPLDLAVVGPGFFRVTTASGGTAYTRNGSFRSDASGRLVTASGEALSPAVTVPSGAESISVAADGRVSAAVNGKLQPVGRIDLFTFQNPDALSPLGGGLVAATAGSGPATPADPRQSRIEQGCLEGSNSDLADDTVTEITSSATYTALARVVRTADEMQQSLLDLVA